MNQYWLLVNWTYKKKLHGNLNQNTVIFTQENAFENAVYKTWAILSKCPGNQHPAFCLGSSLTTCHNHRAHQNEYCTKFVIQMVVPYSAIWIAMHQLHKFGNNIILWMYWITFTMYIVGGTLIEYYVLTSEYVILHLLLLIVGGYIGYTNAFSWLNN